jgi:hypothetical protein
LVHHPIHLEAPGEPCLDPSIPPSNPQETCSLICVPQLFPVKCSTKTALSVLVYAGKNAFQLIFSCSMILVPKL